MIHFDVRKDCLSAKLLSRVTRKYGTENMSGFCELTREDVKEIDGGHDRAHRNHNRLTGSRKSAASAQWTTTGWAVSAIGVALAVPNGGTSIAFASLGVALATGSLVTM